MGKTISAWECELEEQIHDCLSKGSLMDLFCTECMTLKDILESNQSFSREEVEEYFSLETGDRLKEKVERVFGKNSVINQVFKRVTSGVKSYKTIIEADFGVNTLARLEYNLLQQNGRIVVVE